MFKYFSSTEITEIYTEKHESSNIKQMNATNEKILEIIENSGVLAEAGQLDLSKSLAEQGFDSLDLVNVYLQVEENFDLKIPDEDLEEVKSVDQIVEYVNNKIN